MNSFQEIPEEKKINFLDKNFSKILHRNELLTIEDYFFLMMSMLEFHPK
jgi:hypothetical protein